MRAVRLARAVADPQHMRGVVMLATGAVEARQGFFITEQQGFMAGIEIDHAHLRRSGRRHAACRHKGHSLVNLTGHFLIARLAGCQPQTLIPAMHFGQIGIAAFGSAQQISVEAA